MSSESICSVPRSPKSFLCLHLHFHRPSHPPPPKRGRQLCCAGSACSAHRISFLPVVFIFQNHLHRHPPHLHCSKPELGKENTEGIRQREDETTVFSPPRTVHSGTCTLVPFCAAACRRLQLSTTNQSPRALVHFSIAVRHFRVWFDPLLITIVIFLT